MLLLFDLLFDMVKLGLHSLETNLCLIGRFFEMCAHFLGHSLHFLVDTDDSLRQDSIVIEDPTTFVIDRMGDSGDLLVKSDAEFNVRKSIGSALSPASALRLNS